jgi:hypothetical protein
MVRSIDESVTCLELQFVKTPLGPKCEGISISLRRTRTSAYFNFHAVVVCIYSRKNMAKFIRVDEHLPTRPMLDIVQIKKLVQMFVHFHV